MINPTLLPTLFPTVACPSHIFFPISPSFCHIRLFLHRLISSFHPHQVMRLRPLPSSNESISECSPIPQELEAALAQVSACPYICQVTHARCAGEDTDSPAGSGSSKKRTCNNHRHQAAATCYVTAVQLETDCSAPPGDSWVGQVQSDCQQHKAQRSPAKFQIPNAKHEIAQVCSRTYL